MNSKITLAAITKLLSARSSQDEKVCENVLKNFFQQISGSLESGESVKIKGFGTFKLSRVESRKSVDVSSGLDNEIPAHSRIVFVPAKELASAVNAPFEMFETIELDESILEEDLMLAESQQNDLMIAGYETALIEEREKEKELIEKYPDLPEIMENEEAGGASEEAEERNGSDEENSSSEKPGKCGNSTEKVESGDSATPDDAKDLQDAKLPENAPEAYHPGDSGEEDEGYGNACSKVGKPGFRHGFIWGMAGALCLFALGLAILWFVNDDFAGFGRGLFRGGAENRDVPAADTAQISAPPVTANAQEGEIAMEENAITGIETGMPDVVEDEVSDRVVPTQPSDKKTVYDTITTTHYLTTMAKRHYGNYHLWPYIYKENEKILGHPNRIRPGTRVVIPDLSKYGVNPKNSEDIEKAKRMGAEIYRKYD